MKTVLTRRADQSLLKIAAYIAKHNKVRALTFAGELRTIAVSIGNAPRAYPVVERYARAGIRSRSYGNYLIYYRIDAEVITIIDFVHAAREQTTKAPK